MTDRVKAKQPEINIASEPWVRSQLMDTENRIEKAFHDQTRFIIDQLTKQKEDSDKRFEAQRKDSNEQFEAQRREFTLQGRWMIGLTLTLVVAILIGVFFK